MVSQVGLNPSVNMTMGTASPNHLLNPNNINSLTNPLTNPNHNYENDIMMSGMDFSSALAYNPKTETTKNTDIQTQNQPLAVSENKQPEKQLNFQGEPENQNTKITEETPKSSNIAKVGCAILGFFAPLANKAIALCKGGKFKDLFKFKELAITCPVIAVAGFGTGMLIDSCIDSYKSKKLNAKA